MGRTPLGKASAAAFARSKRLPPRSAADALVGLFGMRHDISGTGEKPAKGPAADQGIQGALYVPVSLRIAVRSSEAHS